MMMVSPFLNSLIVASVLVLPMAAGDECPSKPATPAEQYLAIAKEFNGEGYALRQAKTDQEREKLIHEAERDAQKVPM